MSKEIQLEFAKLLSNKVNEDFSNGYFLENVNPITKNLLEFWFSENICELRNINFNDGQKQAILNIIYIHEVLKSKNVREFYEAIAPDLLLSLGIEKLEKEYQQYCVKMATGTGKTWVMQAIIIWQYLNAKYKTPGNFTKNFLLIAPGLIVYDRLLDAFLGKEDEIEKDKRIFEKSDIYSNKDLFLPDIYKTEFLNFLQSSVIKKEDIGKSKDDGMIILTNWHLLKEKEEELEKESESVISPGIELNAQDSLNQVMPIRPGISTGNSLDVLDGYNRKGEELKFLSKLKDLMVISDEAHHIREGEEDFTVWKKAINKISKNKTIFIQLDFSATPYTQKGTNKNYFNHIIVDFDLFTAIKKGYVKTIVLDKRMENASQLLEYRVERDESGDIVSLSDGQRIMLRAGVAKLKKLEEQFDEKIKDDSKNPKMLIMCEDTMVVPFVRDFLISEGIDIDNIIEIHSNKKTVENLSEEEWKDIKKKLFAIDKHRKPKIIISVLMLREGFDVNNICVIVPLRSTQSNILLEQTIGRGLRIMFREPEYQEMKLENRTNVFTGKAPNSYIDILSIVEHPSFIKYYQELMDNGLIGLDNEGFENLDNVLGDIITVELKSDYKKYDFIFPIIIQEPEDIIKTNKVNIDSLAPYHLDFEQLKKLVPGNDRFISEEITKGTKFGDYTVSSGVMTSQSYNEYIARLVNRVISLISDREISARHPSKQYPILQINNSYIASFVDDYLCYKLFKKEINPLDDNNWRVFLISDVINHIISQVSQAILKMQYSEENGEYKIIERKLSEVQKIRMRDNFSIDVNKCIYPKLKFPSNKGGLEKDFIEFCDNDSSVEAFLKIEQGQASFVRFRYTREDGLAAFYYPDFLVKCNNKIYIIETKGQRDLNVNRKKISALDNIKRINKLPENLRDNRVWEYVLIDENIFYDFKNKNANIIDLLEYCKLRENKETLI